MARVRADLKQGRKLQRAAAVDKIEAVCVHTTEGSCPPHLVASTTHYVGWAILNAGNLMHEIEDLRTLVTVLRGRAMHG